MRLKFVVGLMAAAGLLGASAVQADELSPYMVRVRAVNVGFTGNGLDVGGGNTVKAQDTVIPEVDLSYFFTRNIAAELVLTTPQDVKVNLNGTQIGTVQALPPSLVLQYHFTDMGAFKPYIGAGVNYTVFYKRDNILGGAVHVDNSSTGFVAQVGVDYALTRNVSLNVDVKYVQMSTNVTTAGGTSLGKLDLNPITAGVGVGYRF